MKIVQEESRVIIKDVNNFNLIKTLKSGQTFRYYEVDDGVIVITGNHACYMEMNNNDLVLECNEQEVEIWIEFFNLNTNYDEIKEKIVKVNSLMSDVIKHSDGVRIIKQDAYESMLTFIISANNNMVRIKKSINQIAERFGDEISTIRGIKCYALPSCDILAKIDESELRKTGVGFRDKYLIELANKMVNFEIDIEQLKNLSAIELKANLMKVKGIGNKVADCVTLFGFNKFDVFPVDVWIERFMLEYFLKENKKYKKEEIEKKGKEIFDKYAGYAQQYIFYYCITKYKNELRGRTS